MRTLRGLLLVAWAGLLAGCTEHVTGTLTILAAPASVSSISLSGAIHLSWSDDSYLSDPSAFDHYRVFSTSYNLDLNQCGATWSLEGTTVAPTFLVGALTNGVPRCFRITGVAIDGGESNSSPLHFDTPRPDAKSVVVFTTAGNPAANGFRFWFDANSNTKVDSGELGLVGAAGTSADFTVQVNGANLEIAPVFSGTKVQSWGIVNDLTDIDIAPVSGYASTPATALVRTGYVFQINEGDGFYRYGAIKVSAVGSNYIIFDWSYQTDPGNPELLRMGRIASMP